MGHAYDTIKDETENVRIIHSGRAYAFGCDGMSIGKACFQTEYLSATRGFQELDFGGPAGFKAEFESGQSGCGHGDSQEQWQYCDAVQV